MECSTTMKSRKTIFVLAYIAIIVLLSIDWAYSLHQYYTTPIDGDLPGAIVPADDVLPILDSPLGFKTLFDGEQYPNPNKYFAHSICHLWFNNVPLFLQHIVSPIDSLYLACAIGKLLMHILLIIIIIIVITGSYRIWSFKSITLALLITTLFQSHGYQTYIGIIDIATTYSFFYALPTIVLLISLLPLLLEVLHNKKIPHRVTILWLVWIPLCTLSGPLNPGVALIICFIWFVISIIKKQKLTFNQKVLLTALSIFSLYSLFLGSYNSINGEHVKPIIQRYIDLPKGLFYILTGKLAWPILITSLIINTILVKHTNATLFKQLKQRWIIILTFSTLYLLLLPLGGYRDYRPYIIRYDTFIPITITMIYMYAYSTYHLTKYYNAKRRCLYLPFTILIMLIFSNADNNKYTNNQCERNAIEQIATSNSKIVEINTDCLVAEWKKSTNPQDSKLACKMLERLNIISDEKLYFHSMDK